MRILEFVLSLEKGGRTKRALQLCRYLAQHGHNVSALVLQPPPQWVIDEYLSEIDWHCIPRREGIDISSLWKLFSYIRSEKFDVIHAHCETSMLYAGIIGRVLNIPVLGTYHRSVLTAYAPRWQWRFIAKLLSAVVAVSHQRAALLKNNLRVPVEKLNTIHGAIELNEFPADSISNRHAARVALNLDEHNIIWFSAGHLGEIKGHDDSIKALALLNQDIRDELHVRLYIAGDGKRSDYQRLNNLASSLGVADQVVLLGQVNNIPQWLAACDLFLQPSLEEAFGLVFAEAGAAQRPVVATAVGGIPDIVLHEETGLLVAPHAPVELAAALLLLSKNKELAEKMGVAARARVIQHFTLEHMLHQYEALLQKLVDSKAP
jgi:glycosyltransferase involved in cell wall biosynthesis